MSLKHRRAQSKNNLTPADLSKPPLFSTNSAA